MSILFKLLIIFHFIVGFLCYYLLMRETLYRDSNLTLSDFVTQFGFVIAGYFGAIIVLFLYIGSFVPDFILLKKEKNE